MEEILHSSTHTKLQNENGATITVGNVEIYLAGNIWSPEGRVGHYMNIAPQ